MAKKESHLWNEPPLTGREDVFLSEDGVSWTAPQLLIKAQAIAESYPDGEHGIVGLSSHSAAFMVAAVLAAWSRGDQPLILDPNLKEEPAAIRDGVPVVTDRPSSSLPRAIIARDEARTALNARWPGLDDVAVHFLTSGSTGEPKVVTKRGYQLVFQMEREIAWLGASSGLRVLSMVPPFHILGHVYGFFMPVLIGGSTTYLHQYGPSRCFDFICTHQPDLVVGVPTHYRFLVNFIDRELPEVLYLSSGAPLSPAIADDFRAASGREICQIYGSTETGGVGKRTGFGPWQPFPDLNWRCRSEDGRLMVRSPWQERPAEWTVTDDLAEITDDGGMKLLGRADSIVKVGGKRFSTNEIIQLVENLDQVESGVAVTYERYGENAVALFMTSSEPAADVEKSVRRELAARLAAFKVPRTIRVVEEMPLLSNGKVDRRRLRQIAVEGE